MTPAADHERSTRRPVLRLVRNAVLAIGLLALTLIAIVNMRAKPIPAAPAYDPELRVPLFDHAPARLGDLVGAGKFDMLIDAGRALAREDPSRALAILHAIPDEHPRHADALRFIGWHIHAEAGEDPDLGVAYVNASLRADPSNGNAWQDLARVYLRSFADIGR